MAHITRRRFLAGMAATLAANTVPAAAVLTPTPSQSAGPFYPTEVPLDDDNDLAHVDGVATPAQGRITDLGGRLLDQNGNPVAETRIEIWQCDANGRYRHPRDPGRRALDPGFQGHGHNVTDLGGRYRFRTIRPVPYPGRTPHIHVAVFPDGHRPFVTQLYVAGEKRNASDFLFNGIPVEQRHLIVAPFKPSGRDDVEMVAAWDIVLGITPT